MARPERGCAGEKVRKAGMATSVDSDVVAVVVVMVVVVVVVVKKR